MRSHYLAQISIARHEFPNEFFRKYLKLIEFSFHEMIVCEQ